MKQLVQKIETAISESQVDAVLALGVDNFNYLTRTVLPFAEHYPSRQAAALFPKEGSPFAIVPQDWSEAVKDQGWIGETRVYDENRGYETDAFVTALEELLTETSLDNAKIGVDPSRITKGLMNSLQKKLPKVNWESIDSMIRTLRIKKTRGEIDRIEKACKQADRGIVYALMHLEGTIDIQNYTVEEFTERIRVHANENGGSGISILNCAFGGEGQLYYTPQKGWIKNGDIFRMDTSNHYKGYWANVARMGVTGKPSPSQEKAYKENLQLRDRALESLKPGVTGKEVFKSVALEAEKQAISFWKEPGVGHGVGASHHEAPYLNQNCDTQLEAGMVIALDIYSYGPRQELIHNKDIYLITDTGNRKLSWYRNWDKLYHVFGFRTTH